MATSWVPPRTFAAPRYIGEESIVPGSVTRRSRSLPTFAAVIPLAAPVESERCGPSPNSGQTVGVAAAVGVACPRRPPAFSGHVGDGQHQRQQ